MKISTWTREVWNAAWPFIVVLLVFSGISYMAGRGAYNKGHEEGYEEGVIEGNSRGYYHGCKDMIDIIDSARLDYNVSEVDSVPSTAILSIRVACALKLGKELSLITERTKTLR